MLNLENDKQPKKFIVARNDFLDQNVYGYCNRQYKTYGEEGNPVFLNILKNTFGEKSIEELDRARKEVEEILINDLEKIKEMYGYSEFVCVSVPRAKAFFKYSKNQQQFNAAICNVVKKIPSAIDGTEVICRHTSTKTTHLQKAISSKGLDIENEGDMPYPGITAATCMIDNKLIEGKNIILVDDVYTRGVNIDEDCIQTLLNEGAKEIVFYAVAKTGRIE